MTTHIPSAEPARDQWGRYLIAPASGKGKPVGHTRVTSIAKVLDEQSTLTDWKLRTATAGLVARPDLWALAHTQLGDNRALNRTLKDAIEAGGGSDRANIGTALHSLTEHVDRGDTTCPTPLEMLPDISAYVNMMRNANVVADINHIEQLLVIGDQHEPIAGTCDRIVTVDGSKPMIADLKTGRSLDYSWQSMAIQLALYAHATTTYDPTTGTHGPMPTVDQKQGLIIHLPAGEARCELHLIDLQLGWQSAQLALKVRAARKQKGWSRKLELASPEELALRLTQIRADLAERIDRIKTLGKLDVLRATWPAGMPTLKQSETHSRSDLDMIGALLSNLERELEVPF